MSYRFYRTHQFLFLLILVLAALLRFTHLGHSSLWSDEGNTWALLSRSFGQIARDAAADIHPPGYYWLLKLWTSVVGATAVGMRSFSALLGIALVYLIYQIGLLLSPLPAGSLHSWNVERSTAALLAAFLAALNPFQIYYSQEARMYMLLAVAGAGLVWSLLRYLDCGCNENWRFYRNKNSRSPSAQRVDGVVSDRSNVAWGALGGYILCGTVGVWTHYSFPIILFAVGLGSLIGLLSVRARNSVPLRSPVRAIVMFVLANFIILVAYLPWLPTAVTRLLAWPAGGEPVPWWAGVQVTLQTLLVGPLDQLPEPQWVWLGAALLLPMVGTGALYRQAVRQSATALQVVGVTVVLLWWLLPIGLMFGAGLFTDAFLKFLLTASPAWVLLMAAGGTLLLHRRLVRFSGMLLIAGGGVILAMSTLPHYYTSPTVRDNYAGVAAYIEAVADPQEDLVVLDAPGQQEVWDYYDPGIPTIALPHSRPPDPDATLKTLQRATAGRHNLYALFWATDEADPQRLVETWLDQHAFKGLESWQGNLRFVLYTLSETKACASLEPVIQWGASIQLRQRCFSSEQPTVRAGEVALVSLAWQTDTLLAERYKVTVQLLNEQNQVIAQRDSEPVGSSRPTDSWRPDETIWDNHGLWIPVGTPPGTYRMILALYDSITGERLPVGDDDFWRLGEVVVLAPEDPFPVALLPVQHRLNQKIGPVLLLGYTAHRQGMAHAPETPLQPGDPVVFTFFWQAPSPLPAQWPAELTITLTLGTQQLTFPLAGESYPTSAWRSGQILQYSVMLPFDGTDRYPQVQIEEQSVVLLPLPIP